MWSRVSLLKPRVHQSTNKADPQHSAISAQKTAAEPRKTNSKTNKSQCDTRERCKRHLSAFVYHEYNAVSIAGTLEMNFEVLPDEMALFSTWIYGVRITVWLMRFVQHPTACALNTGPGPGMFNEVYAWSAKGNMSSYKRQIFNQRRAIQIHRGSCSADRLVERLTSLTRLIIVQH